MKDTIHIPPSAVEAAENAYCEAWDRAEPALLAAIRAALAAWPGMHTREWPRPWPRGMSGTDIILPLNTENPDDPV